MEDKDLMALELRVSRNFDVLVELDQADPRLPGWLEKWKLLLAQYEIYLTTHGLPCAPGGEWDK